MNSTERLEPTAASAAGSGLATPTAERLLLLDVLRGVALMGILVMNLPTFTGGMPSPAELAQPLDHAAQALREALFFGKFNAIFSLLFGLSFTLQFERLLAREPDRALSIYTRRLVGLLGLGLVHLVFFYRGDVLHLYALMGFGLLLLRRCSSRTLLVLVLLSVAGPALSQLLRALIEPSAQAASMTASARDTWDAADVRAYGEGTLADTMRANLRDLASTYGSPRALLSQLGFLAQLVTTMLLGLLIGRHGWLYRLPELMPRIARLRRGSLALGLVCSVLLLLAGGPAMASVSVMHAVVGSAFVLGRLSLMAFYVTTLVSALQSPRWQQRLTPFAAAGRMPLTNYLMQTALCGLLFSGWGLGLWNRLGPAAELAAALLLFFAVQVPLSLWWLKRFGQGPFEWLWRRFTYGRRAAA